MPTSTSVQSCSLASGIVCRATTENFAIGSNKSKELYEKKASLGVGLGLVLVICFGAVAAEWVADGTIEGKSGHLRMDTKSNTAILTNSLGNEFIFHISCVHRTEGWVPPSKIMNQKLIISQEEKK